MPYITHTFKIMEQIKAVLVDTDSIVVSGIENLELLYDVIMSGKDFIIIDKDNARIVRGTSLKQPVISGELELKAII